jgi:hypothetical protein
VLAAGADERGMSAVELPEPPGAGMPRILHHCGVAARRHEGRAQDRLARVLGSDLATRLVGALARRRR